MVNQGLHAEYLACPWSAFSKIASKRTAKTQKVPIVSSTSQIHLLGRQSGYVNQRTKSTVYGCKSDFLQTVYPKASRLLEVHRQLRPRWPMGIKTDTVITLGSSLVLRVCTRFIQAWLGNEAIRFVLECVTCLKVLASKVTLAGLAVRVSGGLNLRRTSHHSFNTSKAWVIIAVWRHLLIVVFWRRLDQVQRTLVRKRVICYCPPNGYLERLYRRRNGRGESCRNPTDFWRAADRVQLSWGVCRRPVHNCNQALAQAWARKWGPWQQIYHQVA